MGLAPYHWAIGPDIIVPEAATTGAGANTAARTPKTRTTASTVLHRLIGPSLGDDSNTANGRLRRGASQAGPAGPGGFPLAARAEPDTPPWPEYAGYCRAIATRMASAGETR